VKEYGATRRARGNELRLGQVFVNLLINASDALRDGTVAQNEIRVRTFDEGDRVIVEVRDNGMGIAPDIRDRIFDPFFTTKPAGDGTGLGLAISHGIVSAFGGSIDVVSDARPGAVFRVSLVAARAQPLERAHDPAAKRETSPRVRVLIVDDEERLAWSLAALLRHHTVTVLTSASDAVALCRKETFDCVVCDLMMPGLSGMDLHAELVRAGRGQERDMIFMTGGVFTARARAFVAEIAATNEVLEKPFSWTDLENAITAVLARKAGYIRPHP
jgi:CheY-like chemotaxis protein